MEMKAFLDRVAAKNPAQPEFLQAVQEVVESVWDIYQSNPRFKDAKILERIVEETSDITVVEQRPKFEGRTMVMILSPK